MEGWQGEGTRNRHLGVGHPQDSRGEIEGRAMAARRREGLCDEGGNFSVVRPY